MGCILLHILNDHIFNYTIKSYMGCCFQKEKEGVRTVYFNRDLNP